MYMEIVKKCKIFKLSNSSCVVLPKRVLDRARLNNGDNLMIKYNDDRPDTIIIKVLKNDSDE